MVGQKPQISQDIKYDVKIRAAELSEGLSCLESRYV